MAGNAFHKSNLQRRHCFVDWLPWLGPTLADHTIVFSRKPACIDAKLGKRSQSIRHCAWFSGGFVAVWSDGTGCASKSHSFVASRSSARICLSRRPEKARVIADICDHSEELADMWHWHCTVHGPDTLDYSRTSKQDHVRAHACMCAHVRLRFGDEPVLLRNSIDQKVRKHESEKRWKKLELDKPPLNSTNLNVCCCFTLESGLDCLFIEQPRKKSS